jgi:two-component system, OmpR family, sensor histidine kinase KdpD
MRDPAKGPHTRESTRESQPNAGMRRAAAGQRAAGWWQPAADGGGSESGIETGTDSGSEARSLYELTHRTLHLDLHAEPGQRLAELIHEIFPVDAVAIFDRELHAVYQAGQWGADPAEMVQNVFHFETTSDDPATGVSRRVLRLGAVPIGSLALRGETSPLVNDAIADIAAITFDRYRATANESRIVAEREAERMRTAVLDGLAHAYKTPLTAIRVAASGLAEMKKLTPAQADLVALIDEQAQSLNDLTTKLLRTARLAADGAGGERGFELQFSSISAATLLEEAAALVAGRAGDLRPNLRPDLRVELPESDLTLVADVRLLSMLLAQYAENAAKYADPGTPITLRAERSGTEAIFSVRNFGPVISQADRERIFERFYRSAAGAERAPGTGIGLSVAKRVALAHGGSVWVSSGEQEGTTFFAAIPMLAPSKQDLAKSEPALPKPARPEPAQETTAAKAAARHERSIAV